MVLLKKKHLVSRVDFEEFRDRHVQESTSWLVAKNWEVIAGVNGLLAAVGLRTGSEHPWRL